MNSSTPGLPVHHYLPQFAQTHVHQVSDAIQPSYPLSIPSPPAFNLSQNQGLFFTSGGQSIGASALASVLPMNIQDWFPLGLTDWISLQFKGLSRVFSSTTVQKHQFFRAQLSLWSDSHIHTWLLEKNITLTVQTFVSKVMSLPFNTLSRFVKLFFQEASTFEVCGCSHHLHWFWSSRKLKSDTVSVFSPSICHEVIGLDAIIFVFQMLSFKPAFSCSSFTFINRLFNSSSLSDIICISEDVDISPGNLDSSLWFI